MREQNRNQAGPATAAVCPRHFPFLPLLGIPARLSHTQSLVMKIKAQTILPFSRLPSSSKPKEM